MGTSLLLFIPWPVSVLRLLYICSVIPVTASCFSQDLFFHCSLPETVIMNLFCYLNVFRTHKFKTCKYVIQGGFRIAIKSCILEDRIIVYLFLLL